MKVPFPREAAVGLVEGKIYVTGLGQGENQMQVFDPESQNWTFASEEKVRSLEEKVFIMDNESRRYFYNVREGRLKGTMWMESDRISSLCVVDGVLYGYFRWGNYRELMWADTKLNAWRRLNTRDGKTLEEDVSYTIAMSGYNGKLAVFWSVNESDYTKKNNEVMFKLIVLDRVGDVICGTVEWSGVVGTVKAFDFLRCLVVSH